MLSITKTLRTLYRESRTTHQYITVSLICAAFSIVGVRIIIPVIAASLYSAAFSQNFDSAWNMFSLMVIVFFAGGLCDRVYDYSTVKYQSRMYGHLRSLAVQSLLRKPVSFFNNTHAGSLVAKVGRLPRSFEVIGDQMLTVVSVITMMIATTVVLCSINTYLGSGFFIWFLLFVYISYRFSRFVSVTNLDESAKQTFQITMLADTMNMATTVITSAATDEAMRRYEEANSTHEKALYKTWIRSNIQRAFMSECPRIFLLGAIAGAIYFYQAGLISVATLIIVYSYATNTMSLFNELVRVFVNVIKSLSDAQEMIEIFEVPVEQDISSVGEGFVLPRGCVEFRNVSFNHKDQEVLFRGMNFIIPEGKKVGIVGVSGAGKSTIAQMVLRHLMPSDGEILFGGIPANQISKRDLRRCISVIPQDPIMASTTIAYNIAMERKPDIERVIKAAKMAGIHTSIINRPKAYDTLVGERGVKLSGGQRQRIAIARAFYRDPQILIMDEATSALDPMIEDTIRNTIAGLQDTTLIVIAHRLATVRDCETIMVVDEGRIVEQGNHDELIALGGIYAGFVEKQISM